MVEINDSSNSTSSINTTNLVAVQDVPTLEHNSMPNHSNYFKPNLENKDYNDAFCAHMITVYKAYNAVVQKLDDVLYQLVLQYVNIQIASILNNHEDWLSFFNDLCKYLLIIVQIIHFINTLMCP